MANGSTRASWPHFSLSNTNGNSPSDRAEDERSAGDGDVVRLEAGLRGREARRAP